MSERRTKTKNIATVLFGGVVRSSGSETTLTFLNVPQTHSFQSGNLESIEAVSIRTDKVMLYNKQGQKCQACNFK